MPTDTDTPERLASACQVCPPRRGWDWRPSEQGRRVCDLCFALLADELTEVAARYHVLDPRPLAGKPDTRGAPGFSGRSNGSEHIIAMRDVRSSSVAKVWVGADGRVHREDEHPPLSVFGVLDTHAWFIAEHRGTENGHGCTDVAGLCRWLTAHLDWLTRQYAIVEFATDLRKLVSQLRGATGERRACIGFCRAIDDHGVTCGARLYAPRCSDVVSCGRCGAEYPPSAWLPPTDSPMTEAGQS